MTMLLCLLLSATVFNSSQGGLVHLTLPADPGVKSMALLWRETTVPFALNGNRFETIVGIDVETKPGDYPARVSVVNGAGGSEERPVIIRVAAVKFPTTELTVDDRYVELSPADQRRSAREARELDQIYSRKTPVALWSAAFRIPVKGQSRGSNFGHRRIFNGKSRAPHAGSDLKATTGTPVLATNRGRVVLAKNLFFTGNTVILDHGLGVYTIYAHLSRIDVKALETVESGVTLGLAGATGRVTGPHLHWSARIQGARVDPFALLSIE